MLEGIREVTAYTDGIYVFMGGSWFRTLNDCINLSEVHIPEGQLQWFIDIVAYLEFITGNKVSPRESHLDYMHAAKVRNTNPKLSIILK